MTEPLLRWRPLAAAAPGDRDAALALLCAAPGYAQRVHGRPLSTADVDALMDSVPPGLAARDKHLFGFQLAAPAGRHRRAPDAEALRAVLDPALVGIAELLRGQPTPAHVQLGLLLFDDAHQGQGLLPQALALVEHEVLGWGCGALRAAVPADNPRAQRALRREGFAAIGHARTPGDRHPAIVMERALGSRPPVDPMRLLCGQGFRLEPMAEDHAEAMFALLVDAELHEYNDDEPPASLQALQQRYRRLETRRSTDGLAWWLNWVIRLPDGALAGYVQATVQRGGRAHVAYVLGRAYWGQGLATRATQRMLDELALSFQVRQLQATAALANHRSLRVLQRLGFMPGGPTDVEGEVWVSRALDPPASLPADPPNLERHRS